MCETLHSQAGERHVSSTKRELWVKIRERTQQTWQGETGAHPNICIETYERYTFVKWWSLILSVAYYGWGVGRQALDATNAGSVLFVHQELEIAV